MQPIESTFSINTDTFLTCLNEFRPVLDDRFVNGRKPRLGKLDDTEEISLDEYLQKNLPEMPLLQSYQYDFGVANWFDQLCDYARNLELRSKIDPADWMMILTRRIQQIVEENNSEVVYHRPSATPTSLPELWPRERILHGALVYHIGRQILHPRTQTRLYIDAVGSSSYLAERMTGIRNDLWQSFVNARNKDKLTAVLEEAWRICAMLYPLSNLTGVASDLDISPYCPKKCPCYTHKCRDDKPPRKLRSTPFFAIARIVACDAWQQAESLKLDSVAKVWQENPMAIVLSVANMMAEFPLRLYWHREVKVDTCDVPQAPFTPGRGADIYFEAPQTAVLEYEGDTAALISAPLSNNIQLVSEERRALLQEQLRILHKIPGDAELKILPSNDPLPQAVDPIDLKPIHEVVQRLFEIESERRGELEEDILPMLQRIKRSLQLPKSIDEPHILATIDLCRRLLTEGVNACVPTTKLLFKTLIG